MKHEFPPPSQEELERTARNQRQYTRKLADKVEQGEEPLNAWERRWVAAILRGAVDGIQAPRAAAGRPAEIPVHDAVMEVALLVCHQNVKKTAAIEQVAEKYGVTPENIRKHFNKLGQEKIDFIESCQVIRRD